MRAAVMIRPEEPRDEAAVARVVRAAFGRDEEADLVAALRRSAGVTSLVATVDPAAATAPLFVDVRAIDRAELTDGAVVAHVLVSPVTRQGRTGTDLPKLAGLAPVAVLPALQRLGVGSALIRRALDVLRESRVAMCVVLGDHEYYGRFGFIPGAARGLRCKWTDGPHFQVLELDERARDVPPGMIDYLPVFG